MEGDVGTPHPSLFEKKMRKNKLQIESLPFYRLFSFADAVDRILMVIGAFAAVANGISGPLMTIIFGEVIDAFGNSQDSSQVVRAVSKVAMKFVYSGLGIAIAASLQVICWMVTGERQAARIRNLYLKAVMRQEVSFFDKELNTGEVVGRMSGDAVLIQDAMGEKVGMFIQLISTFIGGFVVAFLKGWLLTLVMLTSIPLVVAAGSVLSVILSKAATRGQAAYGKASVVVEKTIGSIRTVASFTREEQSILEYNKAVEKAYRLSVSDGLASGFGVGSFCFLMFGSYALAVWFGAKMIVEREYTGGIVINVIVAIFTGSMSLGQVSPCLPAFSAGKAAAHKMIETINRKPNIDSYDLRGKVLEDINGDIELRDISFSYPTRPEEEIFSGFSLSIPRGKTYALVGHSGSGKSTVISLIERFYDPQGGKVLVDGINLKEFNLKWIRGKIGLVSQEPVLFASTIKENIAYGKQGAGDEEIRTAAELANAAKFIDELPQGMDTLVGEHGTQLSGGQKQRVAIARAILKDPRILLLDEATSALDVKSERVVQEALDRIMVNRTTVVVAHRLSTIRNADMIVVIHQGKVVEKGTHLQLIKDPEGQYSCLARLQETKKYSEPEISCWASSAMHSMKRNSLQRAPSNPSSLPFMSPKAHDRASQTCNKESKTKQKAHIRRLASLHKPEIPLLLLGTSIAIANGCILPVFGILFSSMIELFYEPLHQLRKGSIFWAFMFLVVGFASFFTYLGRTYIFVLAGGKLIKRVRQMCFEKVVHKEISWFDDPKNSSGVIGARLSIDAAALRGLTGDALGFLVQNIATILAGLIIALVSNWELSLIILALIPLIGLNGFVQAKFVNGFSADAKKKYEDASQVANDAVGSIRTVASFCAEEKVIELYKLKCEVPVEAGIKLGIISGVGLGLSNAMLFFSYAICSYAGAQLVAHGRATFSEFFRVFFVLLTTAIGISQSSALGPDTNKASDAAASIFAILDDKPSIDSRDESGMKLEDVNGDIKLVNVCFCYPMRPGIQIFHDISLDIHAGKTVALVGESGSGKSTIISLLQRFYDPDSGHITLDGVQIKKFQVKWLRQQMGLVSQEPVLYNDSIRANIAYGKAGCVPEAEVIAAAKLANAHSFISALQQGYDTMVGERGIQLSGGQKQRVAIARAILKNPKILLLDEATSALDVESERVVQEALCQIMVNRTTVVVAHRLISIKSADLIAVVKNGVIAEKGTHGSLSQIKNGVYASLLAFSSGASS